jgi:DNA invertase Pin-like site-specific DNA recombinase
MIYGYVRVSTDKQTTENQHFEIKKFADDNDVLVDKWIMETISASKELEKRKLGVLLKKLKDGDILIASELSRLGRNLLQIMSILHCCMLQGVKVWTIKDNYRLGSDIQSKVLAFAFGLSAEIERNLISQRTKEALMRLKADGKTLGRPVGCKSKCLKLDKKAKEIERLYNMHTSCYKMAKILKVNRQTLSNYIKCRF